MVLNEIDWHNGRTPVVRRSLDGRANRASEVRRLDRPDAMEREAFSQRRRDGPQGLGHDRHRSVRGSCRERTARASRGLVMLVSDGDLVGSSGRRDRTAAATGAVHRQATALSRCRAIVAAGRRSAKRKVVAARRRCGVVGLRFSRATVGAGSLGNAGSRQDGFCRRATGQRGSQPEAGCPQEVLADQQQDQGGCSDHDKIVHVARNRWMQNPVSVGD